MRLVMLLAAFSAAAAPAATLGPVRTSGGQLSGFASERGVTAFLGIPYAKPPTGTRRWSAPEAAIPFTRKQATSFGPGCMQGATSRGDPWSDEYYADPPFSEDCLTLNVWTPAGKSKGGLPVALWIHGGGLVQGSSALKIYNGSHIARQGIVFVSLNYRLNVLGFLAHPDLSAKSPMGVSGNYGFLDDIAALKWIQHNIAAFGGDPRKVTIIGQSGGARSVQALLFSPLAKGLFRGAIAESGIPFVLPGQNQEPAPREVMEAAGVEFARSRGVETAEGLRGLPVEKLIAPAPNTPFRGGPTVDGVVLPLPISEAVRRPPVNDVPVILGHNGDEGDVREPLTQPVSAEDFVKHARAEYRGDADRFLALFPATPDSTEVSHLSGHLRVMSGVEDWAANRAANSKSKVYVYDFTHRMPGPVHESWGSYHSSEIPYWTRNLDKLDRPWSNADRKVSDNISRYWLNFIKTGQPNGGGLPIWKSFDRSNREIMDLNEAPRMRPLASPDVTAFFDAYYQKQR